jgi:hypothetical protein
MDKASMLIAEGSSYHERLITGDLTVTAEIAAAYLEPLVHVLSSRFPNLDDPHLIATAVEDALINYFDRPEQFDTEKGLSLFSYLRMAADGDLRNLLDKNKRAKRREIGPGHVELSEPSSEHLIEAIDEFDLETSIDVQNTRVWHMLAKLFKDTTDLELAVLIIEGIRSTSTFATVLGISDLPEPEQRIIVKRHKDRVIKTIKRNIDPSELRND